MNARPWSDNASVPVGFRYLGGLGEWLARFNPGAALAMAEHRPPSNYNDVLSWYRNEAEHGYPSAQYLLGRIYLEGEGIPRDNRKAAKWFRRAADQGYASAQYYLGILYAKGQGVPKDYVLSHMWWTLAGAKGSQNAIDGKKSVEKKMTASQIERSKRLAKAWSRRKKK